MASPQNSSVEPSERVSESSQTSGRGRVLASLLVLNILVHFVPFERPGFQADDFLFLHRARIEPPWSFIDVSLSQATRPLGFLLFILVPRQLGLFEPSQLVVLVATTTLLTALVYLLLAGLLPKPMARLAALVFVVWPVKHEIYSSQLFGVNNLAGALIVGSALLYRRSARTSSPWTLALAIVCYGLSIFTYEVGYLAPLVVYLIDRPVRSRLYGLALFLIPATLYWVFRFTSGDVPMGGGLHPLSIEVALGNLVTSLPSNLFGFQVMRNIGYGLWGVISGPLWFQLWCGVTASVVGFCTARSIRSIRDAQRGPGESGTFWARAGGGILAAALLAAPAAMVLVESRHSILAAIGMGVTVAALAVRMKPPFGAASVVVLLLSAQGLALRQAEASRLQASVREVVTHRRDEIRSASAVVFDISSLATRIPYTWGERRTNVLRSYWGVHAFGDWGFKAMVADAIYGGPAAANPSVRTCAFGLVVSETSVLCERDYARQEPFGITRAGTLVIDFKTMPLP